MKKTMKLSTKEKTQAQIAEDERRTNDMIKFGMSFEDGKGNPWFLPVEWGWYSTNAACQATLEQFNSGFRAYLSK